MRRRSFRRRGRVGRRTYGRRFTRRRKRRITRVPRKAGYAKIVGERL